MSQLRLRTFAAFGAVAALPILTATLAEPAEASVLIDIYQTGGNVVATGSGTIDLTGLTFDFSAAVGGMGAVVPFDGIAAVGPDNVADVYTGVSGPASFGPGATTFGSSGSGDAFGVAASLLPSPVLFVPEGYVSGTALSGSSTFASETIASLGLAPGTYVYTWAIPGSIGDSLTVNIGVPEPSTWAMMLIGFAGLGFAGYRQRKKLAGAPSETRGRAERLTPPTKNAPRQDQPKRGAGLARSGWGASIKRANQPNTNSAAILGHVRP
jgi:PEP-CTERM motif